MAIEKPEWFKMNPAKFLSDRIVDSMSTVELGACLRLLCRQWMDGDIPDDLSMLARICRLGEEEMARVWVILATFFPVAEHGRRANRFMWIERETVIAELARKSDQFSRLARRRWDAVRNANVNAASNSNGNAACIGSGNTFGTGAAIQDQSRPEQNGPERRGWDERPEPASEASEAVSSPRRVGERNDDPSPDTCFLDTNQTPDGLSPGSLAMHIIDLLCLPNSRQLLGAVAESIRTKAKAEGITPAAAHDVILPRAALAKKEGVKKPWPFWFSDQEYDRKEAATTQGQSPSPVAAPVSERIRREIAAERQSGQAGKAGVGS